MSESPRAIPTPVQSALLRVPPLSPAAARLFRVDEDAADMRGIASVISSDPTLSSLVLRLVNSPMFGVRQTVTGVRQAIAMLGLDRVRSLATTAALRMLVSPSGASPALKRCWRHSVACALASQEMAGKTSMDGDAAYTAGLLHDIGCFAMLSCWPKDYSNVLETSQPANLLEREVQALGVTHAEAGAFLLEKWGLPHDLAHVARQHHEAPIDRQAKVLEMVYCGCRIADALGFTVTAKGADGEEASGDPFTPIGGDREAFCLRIFDGINQLECFTA